jgi:hypothetical protein
MCLRAGFTRDTSIGRKTGEDWRNSQTLTTTPCLTGVSYAIFLRPTPQRIKEKYRFFVPAAVIATAFERIEKAMLRS